MDIWLGVILKTGFLVDRNVNEIVEKLQTLSNKGLDRLLESTMIKELTYLGNKTISLADLHFQYIGKIFNPKFWAGGSVLVSASPHVELLNIYREEGQNRNKLWDSNYAKMMVFWDKIGYKARSSNRDRAFIEKRIEKMIGLYESIKKSGVKNPIEVLDSPFWATRYNSDESFLGGYEIWHGHHRAACAFVLGVKQLPCRLFKDREPGTGRCKRWDSRLDKIK